MGLRIQNNVEAFNAHRNLTATSNMAAKSMERLSSGYRINRAADDAAGLAISEKMRGQIGGLGQAQRNAQDGVSLVQTGEGALNEVHSMLQRVRELKVQYDNDTLNDSDKASITNEVLSLQSEIKDIRKTTTFNGIKLLDGSHVGSAGSANAGSVTLQVGANTGETISVTAKDIFASGGATSGLAAVNSLTSASAGATSFASLTTSQIDDAIQEVSSRRAEFGAAQNRLEHRLTNLATYQENLVASESRIRDVDMAKEMVNFTKLQILQQAGTSMLAQANQAPQGVLSLLR
jgi:flagellin